MGLPLNKSTTLNADILSAAPSSISSPHNTPHSCYKSVGDHRDGQADTGSMDKRLPWGKNSIRTEGFCLFLMHSFSWAILQPQTILQLENVRKINNNKHESNLIFLMPNKSLSIYIFSLSVLSIFNKRQSVIYSPAPRETLNPKLHLPNEWHVINCLCLPS